MSIGAKIGDEPPDDDFLQPKKADSPVPPVVDQSDDISNASDSRRGETRKVDDDSPRPDVMIKIDEVEVPHSPLFSSEKLAEQC